MYHMHGDIYHADRFVELFNYTLVCYPLRKVTFITMNSALVQTFLRCMVTQYSVIRRFRPVTDRFRILTTKVIEFSALNYSQRRATSICIMIVYNMRD